MAEIPIFKNLEDESLYSDIFKRRLDQFYCLAHLVKDEFFPRKMPLMFGHPTAHNMAVRKWNKITTKWGSPKQAWMAAELINNGAFDTISEIVLQKQGKYENVVGIKTKQNEEIVL